MKKILSVVLAILMLVMTFPVMVFAANDVAQIYDADGVAGATYTDLNTALDDVVSGGTVKLLANVSVATLTKLNADGGKTYTIDGNNKAYTLTVATTARNETYSAIGTNHVTFKDVKLELYRAINLVSTGSVTFDSCEIKGHNFFIRIAGGSTDATSVTFNNTTATCDHTEPLMLITTNAKGSVNVIDSYLKNEKGTTANHSGNSSIINYNTVNETTLNLRGSTVLESAVTGNGPQTAIFGGGSGIVNVNVDPTVTLYLNGQSAEKVTNVFFNHSGTVKVNGTPIYKASALMVKNGVTLKEYYSGKDWFVDGSAVPAKFINPVATGDTVFTVGDSVGTNECINVTTDTPYPTLTEAIAAAGATDEIKLLRSIYFSGVEGNFEPLAGSSLTIDGNGCTIYGNHYVFDKLDTCNLTLKNLKICSTHTLRMNEGSSDLVPDLENAKWTLTDCTVIQGSGDTLAFRIGGAISNFELELNNTQVISIAASVSAGVLVDGSCSGTFDFNNSSFIYGASGSTSVPANNFLFNLATSGNMTVDLDATSELKVTSALPSAVTNSQSYAGMFANTRANHTLVLAKGAKMTMATGANKTSIYFVSGNAVVEDNGAIWTVSETAAKNGVYLPTLLNEDGEAMGWVVKDSTTILNANPYQNASASGDTVIVPYDISDPALNPANIIMIKDGDTVVSYHTNIEDAINSVENGQTIVLRDSISGSAVIPDKNLTFTIDGNNKTWTHTSYILDNVGRCNVTIKNLTVNSANGLRWDPDEITTENFESVVILENCNITNTGGALFKLAGQNLEKLASYKLVLNGCTVTQNAAARVFIMEKVPNIDIELNDTVINQNKRGNPGYESLMYVDANVGAASISLSGSKTVINATPASGTYATQSVFRCNNTNTTFTLGKGVTLNLGGVSTAETCAYAFIQATAELNTPTVIDNGAIYNVTADVAKVGYTLPTVEDALGFSVKGGLYQNGSEIAADETATEGYTVRAVVLSDADFGIIGASLRTKDPSGIRFGTAISADLMEILSGMDVTYGMLVVPTETLKLEGSTTYLELRLSTEGIDPAVVNVTEDGMVDYNGGKLYNIALIGIPDTASAVTMKFSARAYITVKYADGSTATVYAPETYKASLYDVANAVKNTSEYTSNADVKAAVDQILEIAQ